MFTSTLSPIFALFLLPFVGTAVLAGIILLVSRVPSGTKLSSAATGIGTAWVCAVVLGIPDFPPKFGGNSMPYVILAGLLVGALLDHLLPKFSYKRWFAGSVPDFLFAGAVILWIRGEADFWSVLFFVAWGSILLRARRLSNDARMPVIMMVVAAIGLAVIAWIGDTLVDRDLAVGVASTGLGISAWLWFKRDLPVGYSYFWGSFAALLMIALRIFETNTHMAVPILLLGFIFFADSVMLRMKLRPTYLEKFAAPLLVVIISILPIILASASALVATSLLDN